MSDPWQRWYRVREMGPGIHRISDGPFVAFHMITGSRVACFIDSGWGLTNIIERFSDLIGEREVRLVNTHVHPDHSNGNGYFSHTAMTTREWETHGAIWRQRREWIRNGRWVPSDKVVACNGLRRLPDVFDAAKYDAFCAQGLPIPDEFYDDGDTIDLSDRSLRVILSPGHTAGHCCLFDAESGDLFGGDMVVRSQIWLHLACRVPPVEAMQSFIQLGHLAPRVQRIHTAHGLSGLSGTFLNDCAQGAQRALGNGFADTQEVATYAGTGHMLQWGQGWGPVFHREDLNQERRSSA